MFPTWTRRAALALVVAMPVAVHAQRGAGPRGGRTGPNPVAPLIDMRRELNLSARQLTQLDSIERTLVQRNEAIRARLRTRLDSVGPRRGRDLTDEQRQALRAQADSFVAIRRGIARNDSLARASAMAVLTDSQRVRVRERLAERRGFMAGRMSVRGGGVRGGRGRQAGPGGFGGRMGQAPRGRMGMGGPGMRGQGFGPQGEFRGRRPPGAGMGMGPMGGGMRGMQPPDDQSGMAMRRRGMMGPDAPPPPQPRRPPADSGR